MLRGDARHAVIAQRRVLRAGVLPARDVDVEALVEQAEARGDVAADPARGDHAFLDELGRIAPVTKR